MSTTTPRTPSRRRPALARLLAAAALGWHLFGSLAAGQALEWQDTEVNTANQAELERVKGVGPQLSARILAERALAPFRDWADLQARLQGIGPVKARRLSDAGLTVHGQRWPAPPAASASH